MADKAITDLTQAQQIKREREEIITKFNLSEENPIPVIKKSRKKTEEPAESEEPAE